MGFLRFRGAVGKGEILRIGTVSEWRGGGLAALLLREFLGHRCGAGWTRPSLEVRPGNAAALCLYRCLYRSADFASAGMRPAYDANPPEDARVLQWHAATDGR